MAKASALSRGVAVLLFALAALLLGGPVAGAADGETVHGNVRDDEREPIADATVIVTSDGEEVGTATTDAEGSWEFELPGPGAYDVELDLETVPPDLVPRSEGDELREDVRVTEGRKQAVRVFSLVAPDDQAEEGETPATGPSLWDRLIPSGGELLQVLVNGVQYGSVIAVCAVGLSLVFGTTRLINFAHGELVTLGAAVAFFVNVVASPGLHLIGAAAVAVAVGALLGAGLERGLWRPLRQRGTGRINVFIVSIGLAIFIRHVILVFHGSGRESYAQYSLQSRLSIGPISTTPRDLTILVLSVLTLLGVALMLQRTRIGTAIRAVSDDRDLASSSGINVNQVILVVWTLAGGLAAFGGVLFGATETVQWNMGFRLLLLMFAAIILGGLGSAYGAIVGSFVVGIAAHLSTLWFPVELQNAWALLVLIIVLIVRPQGILGRRERVG